MGRISITEQQRAALPFLEVENPNSSGDRKDPVEYTTGGCVVLFPHCIALLLAAKTIPRRRPVPALPWLAVLAYVVGLEYMGGDRRWDAVRVEFTKVGQRPPFL